MPETVYRESRSYVRERDSPSDDDDRHSRAPTVRRYKVTSTSNRGPAAVPPPPPPVEYERTERIVERDYGDIEDDRRSHFSHVSRHPGRSSGDLLGVETSRSVYHLPERPRSAFDAPVRNTTVVEKVVERERERSPVQDFYDITRRSTVKDDGRTVIYEKTKEIEREDPYPPPPPQERTRTVVEKKTVERGRDDDRWYDTHDYDHHDHHDHHDRSRTVVEKKVVEREREDDRWYDPHDHHDRSRTVIEKKVVERDEEPYWEDRGDRGAGPTVLYEKTKEVERMPGPPTPRSPLDWDRHSHSPWDRDNVDVRMERRVERRDDGVDVTIQTRREERRDETPHGEFEHIRRETEYYEPAPPDPAPIIIRQRAPEQRIIVQEAPEPPPIVVPYRQPQNTEVAIARRDPREDDYYYRHREIERYDGRRVRDEDYAMYRRGRSRDRYSDDDRSDGDDVYVRRTIIKRERSKSSDHHHRLHLAEGAIAGAGLAALAASRGGGARSSHGQPSGGRGRKVLAGAALGALGTEVVKRARSVYNDRYGEDHDRYDNYGAGAGRGRSRSRPGERYDDEDDYRDDRRDRRDNGDNDKHSKIKTGLGLAAAALAVAGAAKYYQSQKIEKEELRRGRSRNRRGGYSSDSDSYYSRSRSRGGPHRPRSPSGGGSGGVAKAAAGTAAVAGLVQHFRNKSKARSTGGGKNGSKSRSQSRLRTGAEIVAAGLAGAAGKKLYDRARGNSKAPTSRSRSHSRSRGGMNSSDEEYEREQRERERSQRRRRTKSRSRSRSVSRSRSRSRNPPPSRPAVADPELGLVEYGGHAIYSDAPTVYTDNDHPRVVDAAEERRRRRAERLARNRERNSGFEEGVEAGENAEKNDREQRQRSRSRFRNMAAGAAAAAAAGIGLKKYDSAKKDKKRADSREHSREQSRENSREHSRERTSPIRDQRRTERERARRERERDRRNYEDSITTNDDVYADPMHPTTTRPSSPPHASGGAFYGTPGPAEVDPELGNTTFAQGFTQHPNMATTNLGGTDYRPYNPQDYAVPPPPPGPPPNSAATPSGLPPPPTGGHRGDNVSRRASPTVVVEDVGTGKGGAGHTRVTHDDGLKRRRQPIDKRDASPASATDSSHMHTPPRTPSPPAGGSSSHVQWIPLSPQSSQTLLRHRKSRSRDNVDEADNTRDNDRDDEPSRHAQVGRRRRNNSDPSADRPLVSRHRDGPVESDRSSSEEEIEVLPDRFDPYGRPVGRQQQREGWTERRGDFEYRSPRPGGTQVRGAWGVAGTDPAQVERMVQDVSGLLAGDGVPKGMGGWLGLAGKLLGGVMAPGIAGSHGHNDGDNGEGRSSGGGGGRERLNVVAYGGAGSDVSRDERGKGKRRIDDHGYNDGEEDEILDEEPRRRRRRRKRREVD